MPLSDSQAFLRELDKKLWTAADRLRSNLDAAVYKHAVLGLIFLKYVSDSFAQRQAEIEAMLKDPKSDFFLDPADYGTVAADSIRQAQKSSTSPPLTAYEEAIHAGSRGVGDKFFEAVMMEQVEIHVEDNRYLRCLADGGDRSQELGRGGPGL